MLEECDLRILLGQDDFTLLRWWKMLYARRWPDMLPCYSNCIFEPGGRADQIMEYIEEHIPTKLQYLIKEEML